MSSQRRVGFEARFLDRLMCSRYGEIGVASIAALVTIATMFVYSGASFDLRRDLQILGSRLFLASWLFGAIFAIGGWWTAHTWRQLWRSGRSAWERMVYDSGVRLFGVITSVGIFFILTWAGWTADSGGFFGPLMMLGAIAALFFGVPFALHLGYFWGQAFAAVVGAEKDPRLEIGDPPRVK